MSSFLSEPILRCFSLVSLLTFKLFARKSEIKKLGLCSLECVGEYIVIKEIACRLSQFLKND